METKKLTFDVKGMTCDSCVQHVTKAVGAVAGVSGVQVSLAANSAEVEGAFEPSALRRRSRAASLHLVVGRRPPSRRSLTACHHKRNCPARRPPGQFRRVHRSRRVLHESCPASSGATAFPGHGHRAADPR